MANIQNKNFEQCDLCSNPVEHHCNLCHVDLCLNCKTNHLADKTKKHEIVEIMYRREEPVLSEVLNAIQNQEDAICKRVREIASQLMAEAVKNQREFDQRNKEIQSGAEKSNLQVMFVSGKIRQNQLQEMFGSLESQGQTGHSNLKLRSNPVILSTFETPFDEDDSESLWKISFEGKEKIWVSGNEGNIYMIDGKGTILEKISTSENVVSLALNARKKLSYSLTWPSSKVYIFDGEEVTTMLNFCQWCPRGLCYSRHDDLLVSMRSLDETESRVVRYRGGKEIKVIKNDAQGQSLFSVQNQKVLMLTENGNGDICVADFAGERVVVVDDAGKFLFRYYGNISQQSKYSSFEPYDIASDVNHQIIISENDNNIVHIIDSKGSFLCYIEQKCDGGLCVDIDHNLIVGEIKTGYIRIIKYLQ
uniref:Uncharacterized protein LOC111113016 n=1 Tax=Crassostrea virginica TaxID=6565 RepID=A0A8B8BTG4_CRAVI|nr:uncharacterized protein LOC111113016 [Crassostrea virginica]